MHIIQEPFIRFLFFIQCKKKIYLHYTGNYIIIVEELSESGKLSPVLFLIKSKAKGFQTC